METHPLVSMVCSRWNNVSERLGRLTSTARGFSTEAGASLASHGPEGNGMMFLGGNSGGDRAPSTQDKSRRAVWAECTLSQHLHPPTPFVGDLPALLSREVQARHPATDLPMPTLSLPILALGELAKGRDLVLVVSGQGPSIEFVPLRRSANTCWDKMTALGWAAGLGGVESAASQLSRTAGHGAGQGPWTSRHGVPITGGAGQGAGRPQPHSHPGPLFSGLSSLHPSFSFPPDTQRQWKRVRGSLHPSDQTRPGRWGSCPLTGENFHHACSRDWGGGDES